MSVVTLGRWERGETEVSLAYRRPIAAHFGISLDEVETWLHPSCKACQPRSLASRLPEPSHEAGQDEDRSQILRTALADPGQVVGAAPGVFGQERTERPIGLRPHVEQAFQRPHVSIDFAGFSGETLHGVLQEPIDTIRAGRLVPETIIIRALLPDTSTPLPLPRRSDDLTDDPSFRERSEAIMRRHVFAVADSVQELQELGLVQQASMQVRVHECAPLFKLYLLNGEEAFFGFYPVVEHKVTIDGEVHPMYDLMGKDTVLFHHIRGEDDCSTSSQYVDQARAWFDSMWSTISHELSR